MKLLVEANDEIEMVVEAATADKPKSYYIKGIFMQSNKANKNGRIYPKKVMESVVNDFQQMIKEKRALGELGHPPTPQINLDKASHIITDLHFEGSDVYGTAKVISTPMGKIAQSLIDEGVKLGVSSRGLGSLVKKGDLNEVQNDFKLSTIDIVSDPSAHEAFVEGIMEGKEWVFVDGMYIERDITEAKSRLQKVSIAKLNEQALAEFRNFLMKVK